MADIVEEMRAAQRLYEAAGVDGSEGARMMRVGADEIGRLRDALRRYGDRGRMAWAPPDLQQTIDTALAEST